MCVCGIHCSAVYHRRQEGKSFKRRYRTCNYNAHGRLVNERQIRVYRERTTCDCAGSFGNSCRRHCASVYRPRKRPPFENVGTYTVFSQHFITAIGINNGHLLDSVCKSMRTAEREEKMSPYRFKVSELRIIRDFL